MMVLFYENSKRLLAVYYFCKKLYSRCSTGVYTRLWNDPINIVQQKQPFVGVLLNSYSKKCRKSYKKKPVMESFFSKTVGCIFSHAWTNWFHSYRFFGCVICLAHTIGPVKNRRTKPMYASNQETAGNISFYSLLSKYFKIFVLRLF